MGGQERGIPGPTVKGAHPSVRFDDQPRLLHGEVPMAADVRRGGRLSVAGVVAAEHLPQIRPYRSLPAEGEHRAAGRQVFPDMNARGGRDLADLVAASAAHGELTV